MQAAAIRLLNAMPGPDITRLLARHYGKLPPPAQVRVVAALGDRGDGSGRAVVTEAVKSPHGSVRKAALEALAKIGDGSSVNVLAGAAAASDGVEQAAARESLYRIRGEGVEPAIVSGIAKGTGKTRLELIRAAGERGLSTAGDALAAAARDSDRLVRRESIRALRNAAGPEQAALLLGLLTRAQDETERREAARALAAALKRSEPPRIGDTVAAYRSARDLQLRAALLDVMGQVSSEEALPVLRSSLNDSHPEIARAAILALSEWLSPAPMPDLLQVARNGANPVQRVLALRGYIRLLSGPTDRSMEDMVHLLGEAMALAQQTEEKRAILSLLANYPSKEALRIADDASSDSGVAREAKAAVARIKLALGAVRP
jgi:HEAT repeat protein